MKKLCVLVLTVAMMLSMVGVAGAVELPAYDSAGDYDQADVADETLFQDIDASKVESITLTFSLNRANWGWENGAFTINCALGWCQFDWDGGSKQKALSAVTSDYQNYVLTIPADATATVSGTDYTLAEIIESAQTGGWAQVKAGLFYIDGTESANDVMTISAIEVNVKEEVIPTPGDEEPTPTPGEEEPTPTPGEEEPTPTPGEAGGTDDEPQTGDAMNVIVLCGLAVVALGGVYLSKKARA